MNDPIVADSISTTWRGPAQHLGEAVVEVDHAVDPPDVAWSTIVGDLTSDRRELAGARLASTLGDEHGGGPTIVVDVSDVTYATLSGQPS